MIVLNWNGGKVIEPCIESLLAVEDPPLRITVVDNGSTDSSADAVAARFPGVRLLRNGENLLFAEGNNVGLRHAIASGGRFFLLLNNDTEVDPSFASEMMAAFEEPGVGIVGPRIFYHDDPGRLWYGGGDFFPGLWLPRHRDVRKPAGEAKDRRGPTKWVTGCAMLVRKEVIDDIGMLDPSYTIYCEDVDFCLRASGAGWKCYHVPSARVWHKVSSSSGGGFTPFKLENRIVSTHRLFARFKPLWWRAALCPVFAAIAILLLAGLLATGRTALFRGAARGLGRVIARR